LYVVYSSYTSIIFCSFYYHAHHPYLPSFPTRRSSDLFFRCSRQILPAPARCDPSWALAPSRRLRLPRTIPPAALPTSPARWPWAFGNRSRAALRRGFQAVQSCLLDPECPRPFRAAAQSRASSAAFVGNRRRSTWWRNSARREFQRAAAWWFQNFPHPARSCSRVCCGSRRRQKSFATRLCLRRAPLTSHSGGRWTCRPAAPRRPSNISQAGSFLSSQKDSSTPAACDHEWRSRAWSEFLASLGMTMRPGHTVPPERRISAFPSLFFTCFLSLRPVFSPGTASFSP